MTMTTEAKGVGISSGDGKAAKAGGTTMTDEGMMMAGGATMTKEGGMNKDGKATTAIKTHHLLTNHLSCMPRNPCTARPCSTIHNLLTRHR